VKALHGPALVWPARAWVEGDEPIAGLDAFLEEQLVHSPLGRRGHGNDELGGAGLDAERPRRARYCSTTWRAEAGGSTRRLVKSALRRSRQRAALKPILTGAPV
jgi:hypothetical protein